jgi:putative transposase
MIAVRVRLYPMAAQAALLAMTFGCRRFVWNAMLEEQQAYYDQYGKSMGKHRKTEKEWKPLYPFLKGVDSIALQQARIDLDAAYKNFFEKRARFPQFKSRKG